MGHALKAGICKQSGEGMYAGRLYGMQLRSPHTKSESATRCATAFISGCAKCCGNMPGRGSANVRCDGESRISRIGATLPIEIKETDRNVGRQTAFQLEMQTRLK
jgi:hypothetical protein